jgi:hypothetical protein
MHVVSQTPVTLFIVVFLAVLAHHLWHRHDRLLALLPAAIAFMLVRANFPVVSQVFARLQQAAGVGTPLLISLAGSFIVLLIVAYGLRRMFVPARSH